LTTRRQYLNQMDDARREMARRRTPQLARGYIVAVHGAVYRNGRLTESEAVDVALRPDGPVAYPRAAYLASYTPRVDDCVYYLYHQLIGALVLGARPRPRTTRRSDADRLLSSTPPPVQKVHAVVHGPGPHDLVPGLASEWMTVSVYDAHGQLVPTAAVRVERAVGGPVVHVGVAGASPAAEFHVVMVA
jgi:hypothetical protein